MTHNHSNYQQRLDFVRRLTNQRFHLEDDKVDITPIQYDPESPFKYNNFVYRLTLDSPFAHGNKHGEAQKPGCVPIPAGTTDFILRLANPDTEGMNTQNRVENEVATIHLVSNALNQAGLNIVPSVYDWASAAEKSSQGWILQQFMSGDPLDGVFDKLDLDGKKAVVSQMAIMLKAMQELQLPQDITGFGGLTFNDAGHIVSAPMTSVDAGPWPTYEASWRARLEIGLKKTDANPYIQGWRANGVRDRIDAFIKSGLAAHFQNLSSKAQKTIIHADFTTNNMLWDSTSRRVTALLDYDFACISHPSYEFLRSFSNIAGQLSGWTGDEDSEQLALREAKLHGFPSPLPESSDDGVQWEVAAAWEIELERHNVHRPRTIEGIDRVADVDAFLRGITPWRLTNADVLRLQSEEVIVGHRAKCEKEITKMLDRLGF